MAIAQDAPNDYGKHFQQTSERFAHYYQRYVAENQRDFGQLDVEHNNILISLNVLMDINDIPLLAATVKAMDVYWDGRGYWQILRHWLDIVWERAQFIKDDELLFQITLSLAQLVSSQGDRATAYDLYQKAIKNALQLNRDDFIANAYLSFGTLLLNIGDRGQAIRVWQKAKQYAERSQDPILIAGAGFYEELYSSTNYGGGSGPKKNFTNYLFRNFGEEGEMGVLMLRGTLMLEKGEYAEAEPLFRKAISIFQASGEQQGEALASYNLGIIANNLGRQEEAFLHFRNSLDLAEKLGDQTGLTGIYSSLGLLHLQRNEFEMAREFLDKSVSNLRRDGDKKLLSQKLYWLGYALANSGETERAMQVFLECQTLSRQLGTLKDLNPEKEIKILKNLQSSNE
ncbi:MAG: tetratricopeptide repeat protein [Anaerolineales bacterium]|nr:MAG: tetratricopeptide repeat protein [Anaerolineales bacterium]